MPTHYEMAIEELRKQLDFRTQTTACRHAQIVIDRHLAEAIVEKHDQEHGHHKGKRVRLIKQLPAVAGELDMYQCKAPIGTLGTVIGYSESWKTTSIRLDGFGDWCANDEHFELVREE